MQDGPSYKVVGKVPKESWDDMRTWGWRWDMGWVTENEQAVGRLTWRYYPRDLTQIPAPLIGEPVMPWE